MTLWSPLTPAPRSWCVAASGHHGAVLVRLRNPSRELEVPGPVQVSVLLSRLGVDREAVLVIRNSTIVPGDTTLADDDEVEVRPVISGGA